MGVDYTAELTYFFVGEIAYPSYTAQTWHLYLTFLAILISNGFVAMQSTYVIGWVNKVGTIFNIVVVIIFVVWFPVGAINSPKTNSSHAVWTTFENGTEWPIGWATIMGKQCSCWRRCTTANRLGFLTTIWTMSGYDAPFHLSEECSNANIASPRAIVMTAQFGLYSQYLAQNPF